MNKRENENDRSLIKTEKRLMKTALFAILCAFLVTTGCSKRKPTEPVEPPVEGSPPNAPQLAAPADKSAGVTTSPRLYWKPDSLAERYALQVSENKDFTSIIFNSDTLTWNNQLLAGLSDTLRYYWRARSINKFGSSPWSLVWSFTTVSATITYIGGYPTPGIAKDLVISGNFAYLANKSYGLRIIDISNPATPSETGYCITPGIAVDLAVSGNYAYVAESDSGLRIIDISNPYNPIEVGCYNLYSNVPYKWLYGVAASGSYVYIVDSYPSLRVIDVSSPSNPTEVGFLADGGSDLVVRGSYAYVAEWGGIILRIIDVSNPTNPVEIGKYYSSHIGCDVAVDGNYAYLASAYDGLRFINIENPTNPFEAGFYDTPGIASDVCVSGKYAYVADDNPGIRIIDISNISDPIEVGYSINSIYAVSLEVIGDYIYVAESGRGLKIYQVSFTK